MNCSYKNITSILAFLSCAFLLTCSSPSEIDTERITMPVKEHERGSGSKNFTLRTANVSASSGSGYSDTIAIKLWNYVVDTVVAYIEDTSSNLHRYSLDIRLHAQPQSTSTAIVLDSLWIHLVNEPIDSTIILHNNPMYGSGLSATVHVASVPYRTRLLPRNYYASIQLTRNQYSKQDTAIYPLLAQVNMVFDLDLPHTLKLYAMIVMDP